MLVGLDRSREWTVKAMKKGIRRKVWYSEVFASHERCEISTVGWMSFRVYLGRQGRWYAVEFGWNRESSNRSANLPVKLEKRERAWKRIHRGKHRACEQWRNAC
jgi:hypothetical protein